MADDVYPKRTDAQIEFFWRDVVVLMIAYSDTTKDLRRGTNIYWQGDYAYFYPLGNKGANEGGTQGKDWDIQVTKIGNAMPYQGKLKVEPLAP